MIGTPEFFPPEWFQHGRYTQDGATVWSLGCLLYVLLFSTPPFKRAHFNQSLSAGSSGGDKFTSTTTIQIRDRPYVRASLSPLTLDFLSLMLAPNPAERPSLEELASHPFWVTSQLPIMPFSYSLANSVLV